MNPTCVCSSITETASWVVPSITAAAAVVAVLVTWALNRRSLRRDLLRTAYSEWAMAAYHLIWRNRDVWEDAEIMALRNNMPVSAALELWQEDTAIWNNTGIPSARNALEKAAFHLATAEPQDAILDALDEHTNEVLKIRITDEYDSFLDREKALKGFVRTRLRPRLRETDWLDESA